MHSALLKCGERVATPLFRDRPARTSAARKRTSLFFCFLFRAPTSSSSSSSSSLRTAFDRRLRAPDDGPASALPRPARSMRSSSRSESSSIFARVRDGAPSRVRSSFHLRIEVYSVASHSLSSLACPACPLPAPALASCTLFFYAGPHIQSQ